MNSIQTKKNINITAKPLLAELLRSQAEKAAPKTYPIKDFLLSRSYLVKYNEKETSGKQLTEVEKIKAYRIYEKRDETMFKIRNYLAKYYRAVINGNYSIDGMPEIEQGIKG
jgi:hypothetical protein